MGGCNIERVKGIQPCQSLLGRTLESAFPFIFSIDRMQSGRERGNEIETKQNLIKQMRATFWKRNTEQSGPALSRSAQRSKTCALDHFFKLVDQSTKACFQMHKGIKPHYLNAFLRLEGVQE